MKSKFFLIAGFVIAAIGGATILSLWSLSGLDSQFTQSKTPSLQTSLKGLKPGAEISYEIFAASGKPVKGKDNAAASGEFRIPDFALGTGKEPVSYALEIAQGSQPLNVYFQIDPETNKISVSGRGLSQFANIEVESGEKKLKTKTDWAGILKEMDLAAMPTDKKSGEFKVAMFNGNTLNDVSAQNPLIIRIFEAPGGGGPTAAGLNNFTTSYCGDPDLSTCNNSAMEQQIKNIVDIIPPAFMLMTEQFSALMLQQVAIIGTFLDAKSQIETQRELQLLQAQAHKDYQPSDQMCRFGSFVKSIAGAEHKGVANASALNKVLMDTYKATTDVSTATGYGLDMETRIRQFRNTYCDTHDNNDGLSYMCDSDQDGNTATGTIGATNKQRINKDIDFARTVDSPMTLNIDFTDGAKSDDEEDIIALAKNLYWPRALEIAVDKQDLMDHYTNYMSARRMFAINNVAHNSFAQIVAMKGASPVGLGADSGTAFMKSLMLEFGLTDPKIDEVLGANPSYYAQMEVLTKKIYQDPDFYTNLYDKPVNIDRIGVSMDAIKLMQNRDQFEASLRREMLLSMMVEEEVAKKAKGLNDQILSKAR